MRLGGVGGKREGDQTVDTMRGSRRGRKRAGRARAMLETAQALVTVVTVETVAQAVEAASNMRAGQRVARNVCHAHGQRRRHHRCLRPTHTDVLPTSLALQSGMCVRTAGAIMVCGRCRPH